jgi:predicted phosphodiesterase
MNLQVASDLHLDLVEHPIKHWRSVLTPDSGAQYLALVGDTCELHNKSLWCDFISKLVPHYKGIFVVNGNHEFYSQLGHHTKTHAALRHRQKQWIAESNWTNVHIMDRTALEVEGFRVLGCTLWSYVPARARVEVEEGLNDYSRIWIAHHGEADHSAQRRVTVSDTNQWHEEDVRWLSSELKLHPETPTIILTHHAPLMRGTSDARYEQKNRGLNHGFATNLEGLFHRQVKLWCFGHTHHSADFTFRQTRVVSNPKGYPGEGLAYSQQKTVLVESKS